MRTLFLAALATVVLAPEAAAGTVVFSSTRCPPGGQESCPQSLWTVRDGPGSSRPATVTPDGTDIRPLGPEFPTAEIRSVANPEWSPDGRWIAFAGTPSHPAPGPGWYPAENVYLLAADGSELRQVTSGPGRERLPSFTADGRRIVYQSEPRFGTEEQPNGLMAVDLDGSNPRPVIVGDLPMVGPTIPPFGQMPADISLGHSPDGGLIAFSLWERVFAMPAEGGAPVQQVDTGSRNGNMEIQWAWEPRPTVIFSRWHESQPLFAVDLFDGTPPRPLGPVPGNRSTGDEAPDWLPSAPAAPAPDTSGAAVSLTATAGRPGKVSFLAVDPSGVSRVEAALAKRVRRGGRRLCRFVVRGRRLGRGAPPAAHPAAAGPVPAEPAGRGRGHAHGRRADGDRPRQAAPLVAPAHRRLVPDGLVAALAGADAH